MTLQSSMVAVERRYRLKPGYFIFFVFQGCMNGVFFSFQSLQTQNAISLQH